MRLYKKVSKSCETFNVRDFVNITRNLPKPDSNMTQTWSEPNLNLTWTRPKPELKLTQIWFFSNQTQSSSTMQSPCWKSSLAKRSLVDHDNFLGVLLPPLIRFIHLKTSFVVSYSFNLYCNWKFVQKECIKNFLQL